MGESPLGSRLEKFVLALPPRFPYGEYGGERCDLYHIIGSRYGLGDRVSFTYESKRLILRGANYGKQFC